MARGLKQSQPQLAERCASNVPFISNVECGVTLPGLAMLLRLEDGLEYDVSELVKVLDHSPRISAKSRKG